MPNVYPFVPYLLPAPPGNEEGDRAARRFYATKRRTGPPTAEWFAEFRLAFRELVVEKANHPADVVGTFFMIRAYIMGDGAPRKRAISNHERAIIMLHLLPFWLGDVPDLARQAGFLPTLATPPQLDLVAYAWETLTSWVHEWFCPALSNAVGPRFDQIRASWEAALWAAEDSGQIDLSQYRSAVRAALKRSGFPVSNGDELEHELDVLDVDGPKGWDKTHYNASGGIQVGVRQLRDHYGGRRPFVQSLERLQSRATEGTASAFHDARAEDPAEVAEAREAWVAIQAEQSAAQAAEAAREARSARAVRDVREEIRHRGPAGLAALDYLSGARESRASLGKRYGVTPKAIRIAEGWVQPLLRQARQASA